MRFITAFSQTEGHTDQPLGLITTSWYRGQAVYEIYKDQDAEKSEPCKTDFFSFNSAEGLVWICSLYKSQNTDLQ